jgi:hypothetical protein
MGIDFEQSVQKSIGLIVTISFSELSSAERAHVFETNSRGTESVAFCLLSTRRMRVGSKPWKLEGQTE